MRTVKKLQPYCIIKQKTVAECCTWDSLVTLNKQMPQIVFACFLSEVIRNVSELHGELGNEKLSLLILITSIDALFLDMFSMPTGLMRQTR